MGKSFLHNPAIVLLSGPSGIGVIHALKLEGIPVITVDRTWPPTFGGLSCFSMRRASFSPPLGMTLTETLHKLEKSFTGMGILYPSNDEGLEALLAHRSEISSRFHIPAASHIGFRIFDKNWQYTMSEEAGVPLPRHIRFRGGEHPDLRKLKFPLVLKPANRSDESEKKVFRLSVLDNITDAGRVLHDLERDFPGYNFQLSENIPGEPDQLYTVGSYSDRSGRVLRSYTGRKITQYPYYHGGASIAESLTPPTGLVELAQKLLNHMGFHGISQVEFKYDARDQRYKFLEVNGRAWLWSKLAAYSGVNLAAIQYYDLTEDTRLEQALQKPQDSNFFYVNKMHMVLNNIPAERTLVVKLSHSKTLVPSIEIEGEWRLKILYAVIAMFRRILLVTRSFLSRLHARTSLANK